MQLLLLPTPANTAFFFGPICKNFLGFRKFSMLHEVKSLPRLRGFVERGHYTSLLIVGPFLFISSLQFIHKINEQETTNPLGTDNCGAKSRQLFIGGWREVFVFGLVCFFFFQISTIKFQLNLNINRHPGEKIHSTAWKNILKARKLWIARGWEARNIASLSRLPIWNRL